MGMPEVDGGITPGWGGTTRMARLIGRRMTEEVNLIGALHHAQRGYDLGLFNRIVDDEDLQTETTALVDLLLIKNQQGLRQLEFTINRGVETDLYTAQGFEVLGARLSTSLLLSAGLPDSDGGHGWLDYRNGDGDDPIAKRRATSTDFWTD